MPQTLIAIAQSLLVTGARGNTAVASAAGTLTLETCADGFCNDCSVSAPPMNECLSYQGGSVYFDCKENPLPGQMCLGILVGPPGDDKNCGRFELQQNFKCGMCMPYGTGPADNGVVDCSAGNSNPTFSYDCDNQCRDCQAKDVIPSDGTCWIQKFGPQKGLAYQFVSAFKCPITCDLSVYSEPKCGGKETYAASFPSGSCDGSNVNKSYRYTFN